MSPTRSSSSSQPERCPGLVGKAVPIGYAALGVYAAGIVARYLAAFGLLPFFSAPSRESAKHWTAVSLAPWAHIIWPVIDALTVLFLLGGICRAKKGTPIPGFACVALFIMPLSLASLGVMLSLGRGCAVGTFICATLAALGTNFLYCRLTRCAPNAACEASSGSRCALLGGCRATPPSPSRVGLTANASNSPSNVSPAAAAAAGEEEGKCKLSTCIRTMLTTLWIRVWAPMALVKFLVAGFAFWKYVVIGAAPAVAAKVADKVEPLSKKLAEAVTDQVLSGKLTNTLLSNSEAIAALTVLGLLVAFSLTFALLRRDGVPALVFGWAAFAISCHASTYGNASKVAAALDTFSARLTALAAKFGVSGLLGLGGVRGEAWWSTIHDVALAVGITCVVIGIATSVVKCMLAKRAQGKTLA